MFYCKSLIFLRMVLSNVENLIHGQSVGNTVTVRLKVSRSGEKCEFIGQVRVNVK